MNDTQRPVDAPDGDERPAPGAPGIPPTWMSSAKVAVGTSQGSSRVWFTVGRGILNEVYWPRVDRPQVRDLGFIVADGTGFWSEVKRDARLTVHQELPGVPAWTFVHHHAAYQLTLRVCTDTNSDVVRVEARLVDRRSDPDSAPLRLYPLLAPHLGFSGLENRAWAGSACRHATGFAQRGASCLALVSEPQPRRVSVGYVGSSDGWTDFARHGRMTWSWSSTGAGNVAIMTEVEPLDGVVELALGFGIRPQEAAVQAATSLAIRFGASWSALIDDWRPTLAAAVPPPPELPAGLAALYHTSVGVLRTLEDRTQPGAIVASLSVPWGNTRNDLGGYHLVWSRDLVECAGALLAVGAHEAAQRTLAYLIASQEPDGHWPQNQWLDGVPYWSGVQLDEAAFPILLTTHGRADPSAAGGAAPGGSAAGGATAATPHRPGPQELIDPEALRRMVRAAAGFIVRTGPVTSQDRWEENAGLSLSTLAPTIAALVVAAPYLDAVAARYCLETADDWNASLEDWTYAPGTRLAQEHGVEGHYIRIAAPEVLTGAPLSTPIPIRNRPAGDDRQPADEVIGTDFLALVRFGLREARDPRIVASLKVADALLRADTPNGPVWRRYTGDGYGEHADGSAYDGTGIGRGWPLLTGERGHYELCAGRDVRPYLAAMAAMTSAGGMLPEQVWDAAPVRARRLEPGRPSGSAMPLAWAHAEYLKLAVSMTLGRPVDRPPAVWDRYRGQPPTAVRSTWRFGAERPWLPVGRTLRIETMAPARVRVSLDGWRTWQDVDAADTGLGVWVLDVPGSAGLEAGDGIDFTFWWPEAAHWEGRDAHVAVGPPAA